jgi:zinc transport system substrate-binding protein
LKTIMTEPQASQASFDAIAGDLGINVSVFDPVATGDAAAIEPDHYLTTMRQNADNLVASFESSTSPGCPSGHLNLSLPCPSGWACGFEQ